MAHVGILFCLYDHLKQLKEENIMAYMSEEGYKKLMAELKELETVERPKISAAIAEARDKEEYGHQRPGFGKTQAEFGHQPGKKQRHDQVGKVRLRMRQSDQQNHQPVAALWLTLGLNPQQDRH